MITDKDRVGILVSEYGFIKSELQTYIQLFHKHTEYLTLYLSAAASIAAFAPGLLGSAEPLRSILTTRHDLYWPVKGSAAVSEIMAFYLFVLTVTLGMYFAAATLSYMYLIEVLARRAAAIEERLNRITGDDLMLWEKLSSRLIRGTSLVGLWVTPSAVRIGWACVVFLFVFSALSLSAPTMMGPELARAFRWYLSLALAFQTAQVVGQFIWGTPHVIGVMNRQHTAADENKFGI